MIKIYLNGKENKIQKKQTINDLLDSQIEGKMIAVAINMKIIHKKDYNKTIIMEGQNRNSQTCWWRIILLRHYTNHKSFQYCISI